MRRTVCMKTRSEETRQAPPKYARSVSVKDRLFFLKLLFRWSGSIWKMLWIDLLIFFLLHVFVTLIYIYLLPLYPQRKYNFQLFVLYMQRISSNVPLSFLLGFFVSAVLARRWSVMMAIPWMSHPSLLLNSYMSPENDQKLVRKVRLNILRYMNLAWVVAMKLQSLQIFKRFQLPGEKHNDFEKFKAKMENLLHHEVSINQVRAQTHSECKLGERLKLFNQDNQVKKTFGRLITQKEIDVFLRIADETDEPDYQGDFWIPLQWCSRILVKARQAGMIVDFEFFKLVEMLDNFQRGLGALPTYLDINIPLVYIQVIIIAVYSFFLAEVFASQTLCTADMQNRSGNFSNVSAPNQLNMIHFVPIFSILKFIFFMGWFKTAASLLNPLGNDSHDIPTSAIFDYNLMISKQMGDMADEIYPMAMRQAESAVSMLEELEDMTGSNWIQELEMREGTEDTSLTAETA